ncbi:venom metalloproteinase antarease-like TtrivMP_A [Centruroides sculpturatus]|uniref:venom metalloproteinase antarease-like TtrivMP_A n=1 Tax=Centruroides sculpturatus TaxID=218467 RepID=UPI000C6DEADB|nr:venom metalloproteinase antarease-like TtrivMP_A [Centruroides sculpturatus]
MFVYLTISLFITITSAVPTGREDVVYPSVETLRSGIKRIKFRAIDQDIDLRLIPAGELISDDFVIYEGDHERRQPTEKIKSLKKKLYRDSEKGAALHIEEDGFTSIHGIISKKLRIEPEETITEGRRAHRVFEVENMERGRIRTNDALMIPPGAIRNVTEAEKRSGICIVVEIVIVSEKTFTHSFGGKYDETAEYYHLRYLYVTITQVQNLMDTMKLTLKVLLIGVITYDNTNEASFIQKSAIKICPNYLDSGDLIENMAEYYKNAKIPLIDEADGVMLVTLTYGIIYVSILMNDDITPVDTANTIRPDPYLSRNLAECYVYKADKKLSTGYIAIMFVYLTISLFITITSAVPTGREDVVYPSVETLRSGIKRIKFRAIDQDIDLRLIPAGELISDDFVIYEGDHERRQPTEKIKSLKKKLYRDSEKGAALHIEEDGFTSIHGIISKKLRIEPEETITEGRRAHRVFEVENMERGRIRTNDALMIPPGAIRNVTEAEKRSGICIVVEIVIVSEKTFTHSFGGKYDETAEYYHLRYLYVTITQVQNLMDTMKLTLKVLLIGVITYDNTNEASFIQKSAIKICPNYLDSGDLIENMAEYYKNAKIPLIDEADGVMLVTLRPMADVYKRKCDLGTIGIAYVGSVCDNGYKYGISEDDEGNFYEYCHTFAHELAHMIACPHDEDSPVSYIPGNPGTVECKWKYGYIMSYETNEQNGTKFSPCSRACVQQFVSLSMASCIVEEC